MIKDLPDFSKARLLIYGDVMLDRYWHGETTRISPEAPVPVVRIEDNQACAGGAANVALNVASIGGQVTLVGLVGDDNEATELENLLFKSSVNCQLQAVADAPTITKLRVIGQNQQLIRLDFEKVHALQPNEETMQRYEAALLGCDVVVLSDYAKGALSCVDSLIALANRHNIPVLVDPKQQDFSFYRGATLLTPNLREFEVVAGPCPDEKTLIAKAKTFIHQYELGALLVTRGKQGMLLVEANGNTTNLAAQAQEVYDVTGAGDTVIAILATALAAGSSLSEAAYLANIAAGLVVRKLGAGSVSTAELRRQLQKNSDSHLGVLTEDEAMRAVEDARAHGEKVVMTNGCFDILHAGHVQYLQQAKQLGDRLLIAVNDDESVRQLKGDSRPLNTLQDRMELLAAMRDVDWVVPFSEDTPRRLFGRLMPDVLVKGGDYTVEQIAGAQEVMANGGQVTVLDFKPGCSTTNLVNKIKEETV
ncbi:MAG: bifunctional D-glycero-beta-D-manno-heptose-7-phosphate kinase/D-glycero-beta-D-manno-heptose 1-phosphate adenylyltransferase HldE [Coxiellaceae bacterium]|nr:bifunctional D-glycero-beta-D-manno-heptose-7-phosphate kinase/D-glycero-beta-D-manno-heptose 1-phosphate adenylyltransferase HldE [Coxiellaceae bacterium]